LGVGVALGPGEVRVVSRVGRQVDLVELRPPRGTTPFVAAAADGVSRVGLGERAAALARDAGPVRARIALHRPGLVAGPLGTWTREALVDLDALRAHVPLAWVADTFDGLGLRSVPSDAPARDLALRAVVVQRRTRRPFLLSTARDDGSTADPALVAEVAGRADCGIVVDLCAASRADPAEVVRGLPALDRVLAVRVPAGRRHLPGGNGEAGPDRQEVWAVARAVVRSAPRLGAVVVVPPPGADLTEPLADAARRAGEGVARARALWAGRGADVVIDLRHRLAAGAVTPGVERRP